jgi:rare lipoprotein A
MNQNKLWSAVALSTTFLGISSVISTATAKEVPPSHTKLLENAVNAQKSQHLIRNIALQSVITQVHAHQLTGRQATTLYIRNIPFLTFLAEEGVVTDKTNPTERANIIASKINQLILNKVDANQITVSWKQNRHIIKINGEELVEINNDTRLPDTTNNLAQDALQATNRLRRLIGAAKPLSQIDGAASISKKVSEVSVVEPKKIDQPELSIKKPIKFRCSVACRQQKSKPDLKPQKSTIKPQQTLKQTRRKNVTQENRGKTRSISSGMASYYGNESGSRTATGEKFNPYALTAAHRTLPFGTRIRVTNLWNGRSVILRVNDRGPFIRSRIIDVSYGAARKLGMIGSGVASVKVEVLG